MTITLKDVEKIAKLSRITLPESEKELAQIQLNGIFSWIDKLKDVDISGVSLTDLPEIPMHERDDVVNIPSQTTEVLKNAPLVAHNMYAVPKVIE